MNEATASIFAFRQPWAGLEETRYQLGWHLIVFTSFLRYQSATTFVAHGPF